MNSAVKAPGKQRRDSATHGHVPILPSHPAATGHGVGFSVLYGRSLLVIHFKWIVVGREIAWEISYDLV